jgi:hypothetical protein
MPTCPECDYPKAPIVRVIRYSTGARTGVMDCPQCARMVLVGLGRLEDAGASPRGESIA